MSKLVQFQATIYLGSTTDQVYVALPPSVTKYRILGGRMTCMSGGNSASHVTSLYGTDSGGSSRLLGTITLTTTPGLSATYIPNSTYGNTICFVSDVAAGAILVLPASTWTTSGIYHIILEVDDYCVPLS